MANKNFLNQTQVPVGVVNEKDGIEKREIKRSSSKVLYRILDLFVSLVVILPLVLGFWRGIWQIMDYYSDLYETGPWLSISIGYSITFLLYLFQAPLKKYVCLTKMNFFFFYLITRFNLLLHSFGCVNQWRGFWNFLDVFTGINFYSAIISLLAGIFLSISLKTFCNVLAPPVLINIDDAATIHDCSLRYRSNPKDSYTKYFFDAVFSVFVAATLVVSCWRGIWTLSDLYMFPDNEIKSAIASLTFGYGLVTLLCISQPFIYKFMISLTGISRTSFANLVTFFGFLGCVFVWRGIWMAYNLFIVFEDLLASEWITTIFGSVGSLCLGCISSIIVRGIAIDGESYVGGEWTIPYVTVMNLPIKNVPFPEPWIFRLIFACQSMNMGNCNKSNKDSIERKNDNANLELIDKKTIQNSKNINSVTVKEDDLERRGNEDINFCESGERDKSVRLNLISTHNTTQNEK